MGRWLREFGAALVMALSGLALDPTAALAVPQVFLADDTPLAGNTSRPLQPLPVLFVHGHKLDTDTSTEPHYRVTWQTALGSLPSFAQALTHPQNAGLGIEAYYIHFAESNRSIVADALEIGEAVELILQRHDPAYVSGDPQHPTNVQVVLIGYSKGTLSSRLYLKSLVTNLSTEYGFPLPRTGFRPVSEFVAIAPPNHGLRYPLPTQSLATKQMNNGYGGTFCTSYGDADATDFIEKLNGHPMGDSHASAAPLAAYDSEAPGMREDGRAPDQGVLYVSLYASDDRDFVGGDTPQDDCTAGPKQQGRKLARNLATHAKNLPVAGILGEGTDAHVNTVHTASVMCLALSTAVYHRAPAAGTTCPEQDSVPIVPLPPRATVALVLDLSGSMLAPACPGCVSRLQVLQEAAELFVQLWALVGAPQDAIGVTYFRTNVTPLLLPPDGTALAPLGPSVATIVASLRAQQTTPSSLTAMGAGLQAAIGTLAGAAPGRHIVLFTDGMQNVFPKVTANGSLLEIAGSGTPQSDLGATSPPTPLDESLGIRVSVIGIGAGPAFVSLLQDIAAATGGLTRFTISPDEDLRRFFVEELINALRGFSPQLVGYRRGTVAAPPARESFAVNAGVRKLVLKLSWKAPRKLTFRVERNGVDVTRTGTIVDGPFYRFVSFDATRMPAVQTGGTWTMRIQGANGDPYEAAAIVDEPSLRVEASLGKRTYRVGDALDLGLRLSADGKALTGAKVQATVLAPRQSVGTLLATKPERGGAPAGRTEPGLSTAQRRIEALLLDKDARAALRPIAHTVTLSDRGDGVYQASFRGVTVPGIYTVVFEVDGQRPKGGPVRRTETLSTFVRFGAADVGASALSVETLNETAGQAETAIRLRPRDAYGNFLGPDAAHEIHAALSEGMVTKDIADLGAGGYFISMLTPKSSDPTVTITVAGVRLYRGALSGLPRVK
jgi:von Willebrand factor type A domain